MIDVQLSPLDNGFTDVDIVIKRGNKTICSTKVSAHRFITVKKAGPGEFIMYVDRKKYLGVHKSSSQYVFRSTYNGDIFVDIHISKEEAVALLNTIISLLKEELPWELVDFDDGGDLLWRMKVAA